jgi:hypothetical protein
VVDDLHSLYVADQDLTLDSGDCAVYCKVKASSLTGLADLQDLIDKGKAWILERDMDCPGCDVLCPETFLVGDANGSGNWDIDDIVYLIGFVFPPGFPPTPCTITSGDANCSCGVDIDDVVYLIAYVFSGGPPPCTCEQWIDACGDPREPIGCQFD